MTRIVELGVGNGLRATRMIEAASLWVPVDQVQYTGVDLFEARADSHERGLTIKQAHRLLQATGARVRLLPGDCLSALARAANTLSNSDLVVISADQDADRLARAWFYLPRMLHAGSLVFLEEAVEGGVTAFRLVARQEIDRLADPRNRWAA